MSIQTVSIIPTFDTVDRGFVFSGTVQGDANDAANTNHTFTTIRADIGWVNLGNQIQYTGTPDIVQISINLYFNPPLAGTLARIGPVTNLFRGAVVIGSTTSYARHGTGHNQQANILTIIDETPGTNPIYSLVPDQGSNQTDILIPDFGAIQALAIEKVSVRSN